MLHHNSRPQRKKHFYQTIVFKLLLVTIVLVTCASFYLKRKYAPTKCVNEFITALENEDYQQLKSLITCDDVSITEKSLLPLIELCKKDAKFMQDIKHTLNKDLANVDIDTYNSKHWIQLVEHHRFLVKTYSVKLDSVHVRFTTNLDQVSVAYADTTQIIDSNTEADSIPLLPGVYEFNTDYLDTLKNKNRTLTKTLSLYSDTSLNLNYNCSTVSLELPENYTLNQITVDDQDATQFFVPNQEGLYEYGPIFEDELISVTCNTSWEQPVTSSFTIPEENIGSTYQHVCNFDSKTMEFKYSVGLKVTQIKINGKKLKITKDLIDQEQNSFKLSDLTDQTIVETSLVAPWGEKFKDSYIITKATFDEYYHEIPCYLSNKTKNSIYKYASHYFLSMFDAVNRDDLDYLAEHLDEDEMANDFYVMLENIQYDIDTYGSDVPDYEEDVAFEPITVIADGTDLTKYSDIFQLKISGYIKVTTTSMDEKTTTPIVDSSSEHYNVLLHINYDDKTKSWSVNSGYYDFDYTNLAEPVIIYQ